MNAVPLQPPRRVVSEPILGGRGVPVSPKSAVRHAVQVLHTRPHVTSARRPKVKCCKSCRNAPPYNPDPALKPPVFLAEGLDMAARWNA